MRGSRKQEGECGKKERESRWFILSARLSSAKNGENRMGSKFIRPQLHTYRAEEASCSSFVQCAGLKIT
jgi:hypothetical protein